MKQKNDFLIYKSGIIFKLEFFRLYLLIILSLPLLAISKYLFIIVVVVLLLATFFLLRRIYFYETRIEIVFLFNFPCFNQKYNYSDIEVVIYRYGQYGGFPVVIIEGKMKGWTLEICKFFICRFVIENRSKLLNLLFFLKRKNVNLKIESDSDSKFELEKLIEEYSNKK